MACIIAALVDDRDVLSGPWDQRPVDLTMRVRAVAGIDSSVQFDRRGLQRVRRTVEDLERRIGASGSVSDLDASGEVLALAFPDRLAYRRGSPGRFQLKRGSTAWIPASDPLAGEQFLVVADLDGKRKDARIRLAAALDSEAVTRLFSDDLDTQESMVWDGDRIVERREHRLGGITLDSFEQRAAPGDRTLRMIVERVTSDLDVLPWNDASRSLVTRVAFLHGRLGEPWPDWTPGGLRSSVDSWLGPYVTLMTGLDDLQAIDLTTLFRNRLGHRLAREVDALAPRRILVPSGREVEVDYTHDHPRLSVIVQEMFGRSETPTIAGEPVVVELLSPARRPIQVTSDLAGFWKGSWHEVRKEMAGRYPKHDWPERPDQATPRRR